MKNPDNKRKRFVFREIQDREQLEYFFKARFEVFQKSLIKKFLIPSKDQLDIDSYDLHSRHFGLYCDQTPCGYVRMVLDKSEYYNSTVYDMGCEYNVFNADNHSEQSLKNQVIPVFPFLTYNSVPPSANAFYREVCKRGESLVEPSRLILFKATRGLKEILFLFECCVSLHVQYSEGKRHAVVGIDSKHANFHQLYGFKKVTDNFDFFFEDQYLNNSSIMSLAATNSLETSTIPTRHHGKIGLMVDQYRFSGQIERTI